VERAWQQTATRLQAVIHLVQEAQKIMLTTRRSKHRLDASSGGLLSSSLTLTFTSTGGSITCLASTCLLNNSVWPSPPSDSVGSPIEIDGTYPFQSAIAMFWPGAAGSGVTIGTVNFPASSREQIQF